MGARTECPVHGSDEFASQKVVYAKSHVSCLRQPKLNGRCDAERVRIVLEELHLGREFGGFVVNPVRGFNRLVSGDRFPEPAMSYFMQVVEDEGAATSTDELRDKIEQLRIQED